MKDHNSNFTSKTCLWCYRPFDFRKKWEKTWEKVKYCSEDCRANSKNKKKILERDRLISKTIEMVEERKPKSLCPSEVVRQLFEDWKPQMEPVRQVCRLLHLEKKLKITQNRKRVEDLNFKGPIRIQKL